MLTISLLVLLGDNAHGQTGSPFDLIPRLDSQTASRVLVAPTVVPVVERQLDARNPFDLVGRAAEERASDEAKVGLAATTSIKPPAREDTAASDVGQSVLSRSRFDAILGFLLLVLLSVSFVLQGGALRRMWGAALNENLLNRLQRDQRKGGYYLWAFLGCLSIGTFLFASMRSLEQVAGDAGWTTLDLFVLAVLGAVLLKLLVLTSLRLAFPLERTIDPYRMLVVVWTGILGVVLFPLLIVVLFASATIATIASYTGLAVLVLGLAIMSLRALLGASRFVSAYPLHFLLYLCALEIGPAAVAYKLLTG